jgi:glycosyltransferase involved in cell wall biosynthesis
MKIPILILSDSPSCTSGLGRISGAIATQIHAKMSDVFEVACIGYGGPGSSKNAFKEYHIHSVDNWLVPELPLVWEDFVGTQEGVLLTIWDASRVAWLADSAQCGMPHVRKFLEEREVLGKMRKWIYTPVDAEGPNGGLSVRLKQTLKGFERVLNYTKWSAGITGYPDHLPHGIDTSVFKPKDKEWAKAEFRRSGFNGLTKDSFLIGIVATNQARKDWALGMQTARLVLESGRDVRLWCHTDDISRYWDLAALVMDYELEGRVVITRANFTDEQMNGMYSACDVTLGIGMGEGFGFPIFESLASGTPCIHPNYGGAAEYMPKHMLVEPVGWRWEGAYCCKRPVMKAEDFAAAAIYAAGRTAKLPGDLDWVELWSEWEKWLREGVR